MKWILLIILGCIYIQYLRDKETSSYVDEESTRESQRDINRHSGTSYGSGQLRHYSNGETSVNYGSTNYYGNGNYSVQEGDVTYYFDRNGCELGRSVDNGNQVTTFFDNNNREIGHSIDNGNGVIDYLGDCFPFER